METAVTVAFIAAAVSLFGVWAHHRLAVARESGSVFGIAAAELNAAFNDELAALESRAGMSSDTRALLLSAHVKHSGAVTKFRRHLFWRRRSFDKCWQKHHFGHGFDAAKFEIPEKDRYYLTYLAITEIKENAVKALAIKNIRDLLRFSEET